MKKFALVGIALAGSLALAGCGAGNNRGFENSGSGYTDYSQQSANDGGDWDWDLGHKSKYNDKTYCKGGTYTPVSNGYTCTTNGVVTPIIPRPATPIKPVNPPKPPVQAPKPPVQQAPKVPAPAPKAPIAPKAPAAKTK